MHEAPAGQTTAPGGVLILDDDELVGKLVETVARLAGFATRRVLSHQAFFDEITAASPSHVVLDLTMPGMPGEDVLRQLAVVRCRARVIVCSGAAPERLSAAMALAAALGLRVTGSLPKPFSVAELRRLLATD